MSDRQRSLSISDHFLIHSSLQEESDVWDGKDLHMLTLKDWWLSKENDSNSQEKISNFKKKTAILSLKSFWMRKHRISLENPYESFNLSMLFDLGFSMRFMLYTEADSPSILYWSFSLILSHFSFENRLVIYPLMHDGASKGSLIWGIRQAWICFILEM